MIDQQGRKQDHEIRNREPKHLHGQFLSSRFAIHANRIPQEAAAERGIELSKSEAREIFYGMPFDDWKAQHQTEASPDQQKAFETSFAENVGTEKR